jgi:hypothetical protein
MKYTTDQLGNRAVVRGGATPPTPTPSYKQKGFGRYIKTT